MAFVSSASAACTPRRLPSYTACISRKQGGGASSLVGSRAFGTSDLRSDWSLAICNYYAWNVSPSGRRRWYSRSGSFHRVRRHRAPRPPILRWPWFSAISGTAIRGASPAAFAMSQATPLLTPSQKISMAYACAPEVGLDTELTGRCVAGPVWGRQGPVGLRTSISQKGAASAGWHRRQRRI